MTAGWDETEVLMDVSSRRLAPVQHRNLPARGLLSSPSLLGAFLLTVRSCSRHALLGLAHRRRLCSQGTARFFGTPPRAKKNTKTGDFF